MFLEPVALAMTFALVFTSAAAFDGEMRRLNTTGQWVCYLQDSHCIYVNGDVSAYAVTYKAGKNKEDLKCDKKVDNVMTGPCKTTTAHGSVTINVACRNTNTCRDNIDVTPPNVDLDFGDDSHANLTTHEAPNGQKIWAGFQGSPEKELVTGFYSYQYPHISAVVNCFSDNFGGP